MPRLLFLAKKRGDRRSIPNVFARAGEALLHLTLLAAGLLGLRLLIDGVLVPEWRANLDQKHFVESVATVLDKRLDSLQEPEGFKYRPDISIEYQVDGKKFGPTWTYDIVHTYTPDREESQAIVDQFTVGEEIACWIDPQDSSRVVVARNYRWWPWLVLIIPASIALFGLVNLLGMLWKSSVSSERRSAVARKASDLELLKEGESQRSPITGIPFIGYLTESPGVQLAYRLPIDGSPNWVLASMFAVCCFWNLLVLMLGYRVLSMFLQGEPLGLLAWLLVPFTAIAGWLITIFFRQVMITMGVGITRLEVEDHPFYPGGKYVGFLSQAGRMKVRTLDISLVCEESATFQQGTDSRTEVKRVLHTTVFEKQDFQIERGLPFESDFMLEIPAGAMHSFVSAHNEIRWSLLIEGKPVRWPAFCRQFTICVYPSELTVDKQLVTKTNAPKKAIPEAAHHE